MPAINATIVVDSTNLTITPTTTNLGVTVDAINLGIFTTSPTPPGGSIGQLQYNATGVGLGGVANTSVANGNLTFTNVANLKIAGGTNAYYLQTDGANNLTWAAGGTPTGSGVPSGANTQIQLSDGSGSFDSGPGFTFDNASNVLSVPGNINTTGIFNGDGGGISNIQPGNIVGLSLSEIANSTSNVSIPQADGNIEFAVNGANIVRMSNTGALYPALVKIEGNVTTEGDITINPGAIFIGDGGGLSNLNVTSGSQITNGTSNVDIVSVDGNVVVGVNGVADRLIVTDIGLVGDGYGISNIAVSNIVGLSLSSISNGTSNINISASGPEEIEFVVGNDDVGSFVNTGASPYPGFFTVNGNVQAYRDIETVSGSFVGDGNGISNIQGANVSGAVAFATTANAVAGANVSGTVANAIYADTAGSTTGSANYAAYAGNIVAAYGSQPNITQVGILSGLQFVGNLQSFGSGNIFGIDNFNASKITATSNLNVTGNIIVATGNVDVSAGTYTGDGYGLANLTGANVSGTVSSATTATQATYATIANSVAGANVSGAVAFATTANAVAGANVSGEVSFAATANAVAGANVSGQVANALVSGTVYTAAQPNITSVGTLTALGVTGTVTSGNVISGEFFGQLGPQNYIQYVGGAGAPAAAGSYNFEVGNQTWEFNTTTLNSDFTLNLRGDNGGGTVTDYIDQNRMAEYTYITTNLNNNYAMTDVTIDGSSTGVSTRFRTGTVPTANQRIVYNIKVIRLTGTTFEIFVDWYDTPL